MMQIMTTMSPLLNLSHACGCCSSHLSATHRPGGVRLPSEQLCRIWQKGRLYEATSKLPCSTYHNIWISKPNGDSSRIGDVSIRSQVYVQDYQHLEQEAMEEISEIKMQDCISSIKSSLNSIDEGQISVSAYDTAWVALIRDLEGGDCPQFPSSLEWIANNQLSDGSWGYEDFFLVYDRLVCTLACVIALKSWNIHIDKIERGILFIKENMNTLEDANPENMTCGFETVFPVLLHKAKDLGIEGIPYDASVIQHISAERDRKIQRVPKELMHEIATCMLFNLEGLEDLGLDWQKLLKLTAPKGSFLTSPASTAFAIINTKNEDCVAYIQNIVDKCNGGAPPNYPVDIYDRLWAVDRIERLGISRFFVSEIRACLNHIYRYWSDKGLYCAGDSEFVDIDDTSMSVRLLRLHGYNITPNALNNFKKDNAFTCYVGQQFESPSPLFNLYRTSQILYPGETILEEAKEFTYNFLKERLESNQVLDKWLISKKLPDEIRHGLEMPWYASLPRLETRFYLEDYCADDVWIGKALYSMPNINNKAYLDLAKLDYNRCQEQHQREWNLMQQWYEKSYLQEFGITEKDLILAYFLASASIFEPERLGERVAWVKSQIVLQILLDYCSPSDQNGKGNKNVEKITAFLLETLVQLKMDAQEQIGRDIGDLLYDAWGVWLKRLGENEEESQESIEPIVGTINICGGHIASKEFLFSHPQCTALSVLTSKICHQLREVSENSNGKVLGFESKDSIIGREIENNMQSLVQLVFQQEPGAISKDIKQIFFGVARTFYYKAYFSAEQIDFHLSKVLFEKVV
uniref:Copalyl diphosphate synthase n=1 Tax=Scoparia dulcis TaxID=107240 RepID=A0A1U8XUA9_SCODU|nr:copalyl diphosphate synthase [Scoparia dulcis]